MRHLYFFLVFTLSACSGDDKAACDEGTSVDSDGVCSTGVAASLDGVSIGPEVVRTQDTLRATVVLSGEVIEQGLSFAEAPVRYRWFVDGVETAGTADHLHGWKYFDKGETVQLHVESVSGDDGAWSNVITVANTPPPPPGINLYPELPIAGVDALRCAVTGVGDFDNDDVTYQIEWTRDGTPWAAPPPPPDDGGDPPGWDTGDLPPSPPPPPSEVPAGVMTSGEHWTCLVSAFDGSEWSRTVSASAVVQEPITD